MHEMRRLPDFVVIGAMKAGTTSLHHYLSLHPEIEMSRVKEPTFFTAEGKWSEGTDWYADQFAPRSGALLGEVSPDYAKFPRHAGVPDRMHAVLPDAKLIYLVRDPVKRVLSHYVDAYSFGRVDQPLEEVLDEDEGRHYVNCSKYFFQLEQYLPHYPADRILVVSTEELAASPQPVLTRIFGFLGVNAGFTSPHFTVRYYEGSTLRRKTRAGYAALRVAKQVRRTSVGRRLPRGLMRPVHAFNSATARAIPPPEISPESRESLVEALRPDAERLRELTGEEFPAWSV